jgi:hypothetical protein
MNRFKWYRRLIGGKWYYVRYIYDFGRVVIFHWEREKTKYGYTVETEEY